MSWRWGMAAALALAFVALVPQLQMWRARGREWHGTHLSFYSDESSYAAYIAALIESRPRLNDPYTGQDRTHGNALLPESPYTTQFVPAYALALPARLFGFDSNTVFILLAPLTAFLSTLALFRLLGMLLRRDAPLAATLALLVLCCASLAQKLWLMLLGRDAAYMFLPLLRRYAPAASFPLFFIFCAFVCRALMLPTKRRALISAALAAATFALLVYSYFYLWTTAAAWLACLALLWLVARPANWQRDRAAFAVIGALALASLVPYFALLARRAATVDGAQALVSWRAPDLFRPSELTAALALCVLAFGLWRGLVQWRARATLCAASFALTPFIVFNQQVLTCRSLQPVHYEQFIANYLALLALLLSIIFCWNGTSGNNDDNGGGGRHAGRNDGELRRRWFGELRGQWFGALCRRRFALPLVALAALGWATGEAVVVARRFLAVNIAVDEARPAAERLRELAREAQRAGRAPQTETIFCPDLLQADRLPEIAPQSVLWSPHTFVFSGSAPGEERERLYQQLYYSNIDEQQFAALIRHPHPVRTAVFGWGRAINGLDITRTPITDLELDAERRAYADYINQFTRERAVHFPLAYALLAAPADNDASPPPLTNLERFYTRDAGERIGKFRIYRLQFRP